MPSLFVRVARTVLRPVLPALKKQVVRIRSSPARGFIGYAGQWSLPGSPDIEEKFLRSLDFKGKTVYDIGANIGATTLFFSDMVGEEGSVISFEPYPEVLGILKQHIELNRLTNVEVRDVALGNENRESILRVPSWGRGAGSLKETIKDVSKDYDQIQGNLSRKQDYSVFTEFVIQQFTLDHLIKEKGYPIPSFIKFDTEGFETECLLGMRDTLESHHPDLFLEMHGFSDQEKSDNVRNIVNILLEHDYQMVHVESGTRLGVKNSDVAKRGHIYATKIDSISDSL